MYNNYVVVLVCVKFNKNTNSNQKCILEGFHSWDPMVVVGFPGCLATFLRFFFLMFHQSLWLASSEDRNQNSVLTRQETTIRTKYVEYGGTEWFPIGKAVRQGCIVFSQLFHLYAGHIQKVRLDSECGGAIPKVAKLLADS